MSRCAFCFVVSYLFRSHGVSSTQNIFYQKEVRYFIPSSLSFFSMGRSWVHVLKRRKSWKYRKEADNWWSEVSEEETKHGHMAQVGNSTSVKGRRRVWIVLRSEQKVNGILLDGFYFVKMDHSGFTNCVRCEEHSGKKKHTGFCIHWAYIPKRKTDNIWVTNKKQNKHHLTKVQWRKFTVHCNEEWSG